MDYNNLPLEQINQLRDDELRKIDKLKFIFEIIKDFPRSEVQNNSKKEIFHSDNLLKAIKKISIQDHIKYDNGINLLGLDNDPIDLTYSERKIIQEYLINNITNRLNSMLDFMDTVKKNNPEIFDNHLKCLEIITLEENRQTLNFELLDLKNRKCKLLKSSTEAKMGPDLISKLEILALKYNINQVKADLLNKYLVQEFQSRREKALKEINGYLDDELERE